MRNRHGFRAGWVHPMLEGSGRWLTGLVSDRVRRTLIGCVCCDQLLVIVALLVGLFSSLPAVGQGRWPEAEWNPRAMPDDFVLPMPCSGAMAFRPVTTPVNTGEMADRPAMLGQSDPESDYKEYLRQAYLLGPFPGAGPNAPPLYYIGKYEVTRDQYAAVMEPSCPALPTSGGRVPRAEIPWYQAVGFTVRWTEWLMRNARATLPKRDQATAFVRLPTEDEWEYAARGGAAVLEAEFGARTFPMTEDMRRYVWFQGSRSSGNRVNQIGRLEPNPLGIFDVLGNVSEWVLDSYRLNKVGRLHGLAGGQVVRGGDFRTDESRMRSSLREEIPPFGPEGSPSQSVSIGFRPVLAMVAEYSDQRPPALRDAFRQEVDARGAAANDPRRLLQKLRDEAADPALKQGITRIEGALNAETRGRKDQEAQTVRAQIEAAGFIGRQIIVANQFGKVISAMASVQGDAISVQRELAEAQTQLAGLARDEMRDALMRLAAKTRQSDRSFRTTQDTLAAAAAEQPNRIRDLTSVYTGIILSAGRSVDRLLIADEGKVVLQQLQTRAPLPLLAESIQVAVRHMVETSGGRPPTAEQALTDLLALANMPVNPARGGPATQAPASPRR